MTAPAAIAGTYADLKSVKTRSVVQVIIEVPIEKAEDVIKAFGFPQPGQEVWVGVYRLKDEPKERPAQTTEKPADGPEAKKERRPFKSLPRSQQAALACKDTTFQKWLCRTDHPPTEEKAITRLKVRLRIGSRADLDAPIYGDKGLEWDELYARYEQETGRVAEER